MNTKQIFKTLFVGVTILSFCCSAFLYLQQAPTTSMPTASAAVVTTISEVQYTPQVTVVKEIVRAVFNIVR
jgi:hypothetical protein